MTKPELLELLTSTNVVVSEGVPNDEDTEAKERINFWDYLWESLTASGTEYDTKVTYQISVLADVPRCNTIVELKHKLNAVEIFPEIQHEYDSKTRRWHSFFPVEVLENV